MIKVKNFVFIVIMFFLLIIILAPVKAQNYNETVRALNQSRIDLQEMIDAGFNVLKVNDTLSEAEQLFAAQFALMKEGGTADFSLILERTAEITELRKQAEEMNDELNALEARVKEIGFESEAFAIFNKAKEEFADERYDKVANLVEEAYVKISEEQALQTRFRAIYTAGTKTIFDFFKKRWKEIIFTATLIILVYFLARKRIALFLINRKINNLNFEKEVLGKLIKKAQYEYFHLQKIPEELYHIRIEKFGELIRDIDRQIPLLVEEKERVKGKVKEEEVKAKKAKKFHKRLIITAVLLVVLIAGGIFLTIYFKLVSYIGILEFIKELGFNITEGFNFIIDTFGFIALVIAGIVILVFLSAIFVFIRIKKEKKIQKPKPEKKKRFRFLQSLQTFISNKIGRANQFFKNLRKRIEDARKYRRLLKQKRKEELPRIRYLRKQKLILLKRVIEERLAPLANALGIGKKKEEQAEVKEEVEKEVKKVGERKGKRERIIKNIFHNWKTSVEQIRKRREEKKILAELEKKRQEKLK